MKIRCKMWKWKCCLQQWKTKNHKLIQKSLKTNTFIWLSNQLCRLSLSGGVWSKVLQHLFDSHLKKKLTLFWHSLHSNKGSVLHVVHAIQGDVVDTIAPASSSNVNKGVWSSSWNSLLTEPADKIQLLLPSTWSLVRNFTLLKCQKRANFLLWECIPCLWYSGSEIALKKQKSAEKYDFNWYGFGADLE